MWANTRRSEANAGALHRGGTEGPRSERGRSTRGTPASKVSAQGIRLRLAYSQLHDGRGVPVRGRHGRRSSRRGRRRAAPGVSTPGGNSSGSGSPSRSPDPGSTWPAERICSNEVPVGSGVSRATGRPRSASSTVSPCSTNRSKWTARWRSSRTPTEVMCCSQHTGAPETRAAALASSQWSGAPLRQPGRRRQVLVEHLPLGIGPAGDLVGEEEVDGALINSGARIGADVCPPVTRVIAPNDVVDRVDRTVSRPCKRFQTHSLSEDADQFRVHRRRLRGIVHQSVIVSPVRHSRRASMAHTAGMGYPYRAAQAPGRRWFTGCLRSGVCSSTKPESQPPALRSQGSTEVVDSASDLRLDLGSGHDLRSDSLTLTS